MIRNVRRGLLTRTEIVNLLDYDLWISTADIARQIDLTSPTVLYHLKNLEREDVVERNPEGKGWRFGPYQQSELSQFISSKRNRRK